MTGADVKAVAAGLRDGGADHYACQSVAGQLAERAQGFDLSAFYAECLPEPYRAEYEQRRADGEGVEQMAGEADAILADLLEGAAV